MKNYTIDELKKIANNYDNDGYNGQIIDGFDAVCREILENTEIQGEGRWWLVNRFLKILDNKNQIKILKSMYKTVTNKTWEIYVDTSDNSVIED